MTTVSNSSSSGTYIDQLFGVSTAAPQNSDIDVLNTMLAATKAAKTKAVDSSSTTSSSNLGLSPEVLNLLQGTRGSDYMRELLADSSGKSAMAALLGGSFSANIVNSAVAGARVKQQQTNLSNESAVQSLVASYNTSLNNAYKAAFTPPTTTSTTA